jgi:hypothetical protein
MFRFAFQPHFLKAKKLVKWKKCAVINGEKGIGVRKYDLKGLKKSCSFQWRSFARIKHED